MDTCDIVIVKCDERFIELSKNSKPFYSVDMFFHAQQKTLFKKCGIQRFDKICEIEIIRNEPVEIPNWWNPVYYEAREYWLLPAPKHLIVAARLKGEIN